VIVYNPDLLMFPCGTWLDENNNCDRTAHQPIIQNQEKKKVKVTRLCRK